MSLHRGQTVITSSPLVVSAAHAGPGTVALQDLSNASQANARLDAAVAAMQSRASNLFKHRQLALPEEKRAAPDVGAEVLKRLGAAVDPVRVALRVVDCLAALDAPAKALASAEQALNMVPREDLAKRIQAELEAKVARANAAAASQRVQALIDGLTKAGDQALGAWAGDFSKDKLSLATLGGPMVVVPADLKSLCPKPA
jgi:hypothetical protein